MAYQNGTKSYNDDDGGSAKYDGRHLKRLRNRLGYAVLVAFGCVLLIVTKNQGVGHRTKQVMNQRARAKALRKMLVDRRGGGGEVASTSDQQHEQREDDGRARPRRREEEREEEYPPPRRGNEMQRGGRRREQEEGYEQEEYYQPRRVHGRPRGRGWEEQQQQEEYYSPRGRGRGRREAEEEYYNPRGRGWDRREEEEYYDPRGRGWDRREAEEEEEYYRPRRGNEMGRAQQEEEYDDQEEERREAYLGEEEEGDDEEGDDEEGDDEEGEEQEVVNSDQHVSKGDRYRWINPDLLPPLPGSNKINPLLDHKKYRGKNAVHVKVGRIKQSQDSSPFHIKRMHGPPMKWESMADDEITGNHQGPKVDYTSHEYKYPDTMMTPPEEGGYPKLERLDEMLKRWPQDELDNPPSPIVEQLLHFDYSDPEQRKAAVKFRDAELPFKVYNVPEVTAATKKWTDEYVASHYDKRNGRKLETDGPRSNGSVNESKNNFFAFFVAPHWDVPSMGDPPTRDNDWTFAQWSKHARYADKVGLSPHDPHYYFQAGVPREERHLPEDKWTFVSRDLPSFSSPDETFFMFHPEEQKGIQCRFGERGVTAATHYDTGRNFVAMVTGAKRYILSPPNQCSKLGIVTTQGHPTWRHSLLNFAHVDLLKDDSPEDAKSMPKEEREWLERAADSLAIDTVLKAGEVLYIPSHWFHYITSVQKSAQCNVRSGVHEEGTPEFGGMKDVTTCQGD